MAMKPLETEVQGREIKIECTHKKKFPPPQMYGHSAEDVDKMWKQGAISQTLHQSLTVWRDMCGLFLMGPKCLTCPQALLQKPRPGRPHVIETENFLEAAQQFRKDDARANRTRPEDRKAADQPEPSSNPGRPKPRIVSGNPNVGLAGTKVQQEFEKTAAEDAEAKKGQDEFMEKLHEGGEEVPSPQEKKGFVKTGAPVPATVVHDPTSKEPEEEVPPGMLHAGGPDVDSLDEPTDEAIETPQEDGDALDDDVIAALADD